MTVTDGNVFSQSRAIARFSFVTSVLRYSG